MQPSLHPRDGREHVKTQRATKPCSGFTAWQSQLFNQRPTLKSGWQLCVGQQQPLPVQLWNEVLGTPGGMCFQRRWPEKAAEFELLAKPHGTLLFGSKLLFTQICRFGGGWNKSVGFYPSSAMKSRSGVGCVWAAGLAMQRAGLSHAYQRNNCPSVCLPCV